MENRKRGQCACGNIKYSYKGDPINIVFCYCKECQIQTGSDKFFALWVPKNNFQVEKGKASVYTRLGDSGKEMCRHFCKDCGVTVYIDVEVVEMVSIAAVTLNDSENLSPKVAIYTASAPKWATLPNNIHHFEKCCLLG